MELLTFVFNSGDVVSLPSIYLGMRWSTMIDWVADGYSTGEHSAADANRRRRRRQQCPEEYNNSLLKCWSNKFQSHLIYGSLIILPGSCLNLISFYTWLWSWNYCNAYCIRICIINETTPECPYQRLIHYNMYWSPFPSGLIHFISHSVAVVLLLITTIAGWPRRRCIYHSILLLFSGRMDILW